MIDTPDSSFTGISDDPIIDSKTTWPAICTPTTRKDREWTGIPYDSYHSSGFNISYKFPSPLLVHLNAKENNQRTLSYQATKSKMTSYPTNQAEWLQMMKAFELEQERQRERERLERREDAKEEMLRSRAAWVRREKERTRVEKTIKDIQKMKTQAEVQTEAEAQENVQVKR